MKRKVLTDILKDYQELKFIYEYGFPWDDKLTKLLYDKSSQSTRRLALALEDNEVYKVEWGNYQEGAQNSKSDRKIVKKNTYSLRKNLWYQRMYKSYGKTDDVFSVGDEDDNSEGSILKKVYDFREFLTRILYEKKGEIYQARDIDDVKFQKMLEFDFCDIVKITKNDKRIALKTNLWTRDKFQNVIASNEIDEIYRMLAFFAEFAPLGPLGSNFLNRLGEENLQSNIFVRNLPHSYAFEQEILYRCLFAILNHKAIRIYTGNTYVDFTPAKICYDQYDMFRRKQQLYVVNESGCKLAINCSNYVEVIPKAEILNENTDNILNDEECIFEIIYLVNKMGKKGDITDYLEEKRRIFEKNVVSSISMNQTIEMESPYHPQNKEWELEKVSYRISKQDIVGFVEFIDSFGDFAYILSKSSSIKNGSEFFKGGTIKTREPILGQQSLCNPYSAEGLFQWIEEKTGYDRNILPPLQVEIAWINFILDNYKNLCHVFISEETYKRLYEKVKDETKISFSEDILEIKDKVQDIRKSTVPKYRQIYQAVDKGKILCGIYKDQKRRLFPYALQYYSYVPESYERSKRNYPFEVMCYDMDSKRNVLVTYDKINAKDMSEKTILKFSDLDKIYHCLAVAIRYGIESESSKESREIEPPKMISKFLSTIWKEDHRSTSSIFHRKIRKQCMKFSNYHDHYEKLLNVCDTEAELGFVKMVFEYWDNEFVSNTSDNDLEKIYHTFLVKCFGEALKRYHSRAASVMKDVLDTIDDDFIWKMISGSSGNICNEIAFYNERLKHEKVYFSLKNPTLESIDKIYRLFSEFICTGEFLEDSSTIVFTITYEKFYYRKIHMYLMILKNIICDIGPESIHDIIEQRMNNIETIGDKLWNNNTFL